MFVFVCNVIVIIGSDHFGHNQLSYIVAVHVDDTHVSVLVSFMVHNITVDLVVRKFFTGSELSR